MQRVGHLLHRAVRHRPIEVVRGAVAARSLGDKARVRPVVAQRHDFIDAHRVDELVVVAAAQADDPVADTCRATNLRLAHREGAPAVKRIRRPAAVLPHDITKDARAFDHIGLRRTTLAGSIGPSPSMTTIDAVFGLASDCRRVTSRISPIAVPSAIPIGLVLKLATGTF